MSQDDPSKESVMSILKNKAEHIEMMAAAYLKKTKIPPDEVVLVQTQIMSTDKDTMTVIYYYDRKENYIDSRKKQLGEDIPGS